MGLIYKILAGVIDMLRIERLELNYGKFYIYAENLNFQQGLHAVLGPNGSGKSSLMKGILGYGDNAIKTRDIYYRGVRTDSTDSFLSYLPQSNPVFRISVEEYISMTTGLSNKECPGQQMIERFNLEHLAGQSIEELSGGEFRRVQCAQIAMEQKEIIMLDEVEQGLDLKYQHQILKWMKDEADEKIVLANMHDAALAMTYADTVTMIKDGQVVAREIRPDAVTSEMLSDCYSIPLTIEKKQGSFAVFHTPL